MKACLTILCLWCWMVGYSQIVVITPSGVLKDNSSNEKDTLLTMIDCRKETTRTDTSYPAIKRMLDSLLAVRMTVNAKQDAIAGLNNGALTDTTNWIADTLIFATTKTRCSKRIAGIRTTSVIVATRILASEALPVAGDLPAVLCKTDSVILTRAAGTTSAARYSIVGKK